ncbi:hypothetical protein [Mycolicibacterium fluoranthenivorans]|uniref:Uncharacterized protein n=1 Tax=Mycolicibacterium fluoranthenivorans TaxID=258505 RepID=A0A7X5TXJ1_9MYCO|nr:hypothetical protein [Mycolicibacterium fluoranthenivorans]MCV7359241.1 hypothetical protein [Mycolicibacterium fluoranthenivorans]NIH94591.1 hypothetical protein [Mycolicibacterium fluoranthenivorans]
MHELGHDAAADKPSTAGNDIIHAVMVVLGAPDVNWRFSGMYVITIALARIGDYLGGRVGLRLTFDGDSNLGVLIASRPPLTGSDFVDHGVLVGLQLFQLG